MRRSGSVDSDNDLGQKVYSTSLVWVSRRIRDAVVIVTTEDQFRACEKIGVLFLRYDALEPEGGARGLPRGPGAKE